jgi:hypothetical protein
MEKRTVHCTEALWLTGLTKSSRARCNHLAQLHPQP